MRPVLSDIGLLTDSKKGMEQTHCEREYHVNRTTNTLIPIYVHIHQYMPDVTTVRMRAATKALLDDLKLTPRETYDDVVRRLAEAAYDDEPMTPEEIEAMEEGIKDIKAGRVRSLDEIMKELGDDKVIGSKRKTRARNL